MPDAIHGSTMSNASTPIASSFRPTAMQPVPARLKTSRQVRVIIARNGLGNASAITVATVQSQGYSPRRRSITYKSTGIQTMPPLDATTFHKIHGRDPNQEEMERKIGLAAYGRYMKEPGSNPHDVVHGVEFHLVMPEQKPNYADSPFQTADAPTRKKALAKAKIKASITANKYKKIAAEDGYNIWAESKDDNIIHSEQYEVMIKLDNEGNAEGHENLTDKFLPNIWKEEKHQTKDHNPTHNPELVSVIMRHISAPSMSHVLAQPSAPSALTPSEPLDDEGSLHPIAAIEPSLRETVEDMTTVEEELDVGNHKDCLYSSSAYASDDQAFVVYDAGITLSPLISHDDPVIIKKMSRKRKDSHEIEAEDRELKRSRKLNPMDKSDCSSDRPKGEGRGRKEHSHSRDYVHKPTKLEVSCLEREPRPEASEQATRDVRSPDNIHTSQRRSRSPLENLGQRRSSIKGVNKSLTCYSRSRSPVSYEDGLNDHRSKQNDPRRLQLRPMFLTRTELRPKVMIENGGEPHGWHRQSAAESQVKNENRLNQDVALKEGTLRMRSHTQSDSRASRRITYLRERDYDTRPLTLKDEQGDEPLHCGSPFTKCDTGTRRRSAAEDDTTPTESTASKFTVDQDQIGSKSHGVFALESPMPAVLAASLATHSTSQSVNHFHREKLQKFMPPKHEEHKSGHILERDQGDNTSCTHEGGSFQSEFHNPKVNERRPPKFTPLRESENARISKSKAFGKTLKEGNHDRPPGRKHEGKAETKEDTSERDTLYLQSHHATDEDGKEEIELTRKAKDVNQMEETRSDEQRKVKFEDEQAKHVEETERNRIEMEAKLVERHARRGQRADLQRYVPRALRQAAQGDAALSDRNNANSGKEDKNKHIKRRH
jgi:hypothetical protein